LKSGFSSKGQRDQQHKYDEPDFGANNHHHSRQHHHHLREEEADEETVEHGSVPPPPEFVVLSSSCSSQKQLNPGHGVADGTYFSDNDHVNQTLRAAYSSILSSRGYNASIKIAPLYTQITRNALSNGTANNHLQNHNDSPAFDDEEEDDGDAEEGLNQNCSESVTEATLSSSNSHKTRRSIEVCDGR
jgi:hypothetical protein